MASFGEIRSGAGTQKTEEFIDALIASLPPIYQKENSDTILFKLYESLATELQKADIVLETVKNNNYVSVAVADELQIRGGGEYDRLKNENAFELDKIRVKAPGSIAIQNVNMLEGSNEVQLYFIPEQDIDFIVSSARDVNRIPLNFVTSFDAVTNILTVVAPYSGSFSVSYVDTGDVVRLNENIIVPTGLFRLGWSEGGYSELGYGE